MSRSSAAYTGTSGNTRSFSTQTTSAPHHHPQLPSPYTSFFSLSPLAACRRAWVCGGHTYRPHHRASVPCFAARRQPQTLGECPSSPTCESLSSGRSIALHPMDVGPCSLPRQLCLDTGTIVVGIYTPLRSRQNHYYHIASFAPARNDALTMPVEDEERVDDHRGEGRRCRRPVFACLSSCSVVQRGRKAIGKKRRFT